jgi:hypothetical protein
MRSYDYVLAIISIVLLATIGVVSLYGTGFSWLSSLRSPEWTQTFLYSQYLDNMNRTAAPFVLALVIVLGLCIPKRLFSRRRMLLVSAAMVAASLVIALVFEPLWGLGFLLAVGTVIQTVVVILTIFRVGSLRFEREGFLASLGSGLLHLGFVVFLFDFILLQGFSSHIAIFWVSAVLISLGSLLSFYSSEISRLFSRH